MKMEKLERQAKKQKDISRRDRRGRRETKRINDVLKNKEFDLPSFSAREECFCCFPDARSESKLQWKVYGTAVT